MDKLIQKYRADASYEIMGGGLDQLQEAIDNMHLLLTHIQGRLDSLDPVKVRRHLYDKRSYDAISAKLSIFQTVAAERILLKDQDDV